MAVAPEGRVRPRQRRIAGERLYGTVGGKGAHVEIRPWPFVLEFGMEVEVDDGQPFSAMRRAAESGTEIVTVQAVLQIAWVEHIRMEAVLREREDLWVLDLNLVYSL